MRIKIDEDLPAAVTRLLKAKGYDALSVLDQEMGGCKDPMLWKAVQAEERFLITADKGFADIRVYPPGSHYGLLLLRPSQDGIRPLIELLERVLASYELRSLNGTVAALLK